MLSFDAAASGWHVGFATYVVIVGAALAGWLPFEILIHTIRTYKTWPRPATYVGRNRLVLAGGTCLTVFLSRAVAE